MMSDDVLFFCHHVVGVLQPQSLSHFALARSPNYLSLSTEPRVSIMCPRDRLQFCHASVLVTMTMANGIFVQAAAARCYCWDMLVTSGWSSCVRVILFDERVSSATERVARANPYSGRWAKANRKYQKATAVLVMKTRFAFHYNDMVKRMGGVLVGLKCDGGRSTSGHFFVV